MTSNVNQDTSYKDEKHMKQKDSHDGPNNLIKIPESCKFDADNNNTFHKSNKDEVSIVLSIIYGLIIVILAIVFKVTESITTKTQLASKEYQILLFCVAICWLIAFKLHNMWQKRKKLICLEVKSPHASNRWLKGVVALFGFAIIIKDALEMIGTLEIENPNCEKQGVYFANFFLHALYIIGQVILLFFYSKIHIQEMDCISRFGVMHILATNLSVWVAVIADETKHALKVRSMNIHSMVPEKESTYGICDGNITEFTDSIEAHCTNSTDLLKLFFPESSYGKSKGGLFSGSCSCHTPVCDVIGRAEKFLTPLLVEYCLVSSCLLYVMWNNIGKDSIHHGPVPKPSHKFYKSYKGVMFGALMLVATVVVLTLLGTLDSGIEANSKSYYTESQYLVIFDSFLLSFNLTVLIACLLGFYVYSVAKFKRNESTVTLDIVLCFICLTGPLLVGLFSTLGLCAGPNDTKASGWGVSLLSSIADVIVSIVQVLFAVHGLYKEPATILEISSSSEKRKNLKFVYDVKNKDSSSPQSPERNQVSETSMCKADGTRNTSGISNPGVVDDDGGLPDPPTTPVVRVREEIHGSKSSWSSFEFETQSTAPLAPIRVVIRDIMIFLVMCNTCMYIFLSLNGTVFVIYPYANEYFGLSAWTTLASVTAPLSIFLKLHFAACFFEVWSYS